jgi:hypothetical protein
MECQSPMPIHVLKGAWAIRCPGGEAWPWHGTRHTEKSASLPVVALTASTCSSAKGHGAGEKRGGLGGRHEGCTLPLHACSKSATHKRRHLGWLEVEAKARWASSPRRVAKEAWKLRLKQKIASMCPMRTKSHHSGCLGSTGSLSVVGKAREGGPLSHTHVQSPGVYTTFLVRVLGYPDPGQAKLRTHTAAVANEQATRREAPRRR